MGALLTAIAQGPRPPGVNPAADQLQAAQAQSAQGAAQEQALRVREMQTQLGEQQAIQGIMTKYGGDFNKAFPEIQAAVRPATAFGLQKVILDNQKSHADALKANADANQAQAQTDNLHRQAEQAENEYFGQAAQSLKDQGYAPAVWDGFLSHVEQTMPDYAPRVAQLRQAVQQSQDPGATIKAEADSMLAFAPAAKKAAADLAESQSKTAQQNAEAGLAVQNTSKSVAEMRAQNAAASIQEFELAQRKSFNPAAADSAVDSIIDPAKYPVLNQRYKGLVKSATLGATDPVRAMTEALEQGASEVSGQERTIATETDPGVISARAKQAAQVASATSGIDVNKGIASAVGKEKALAALAPPEVQGILDTPTRNKVITDHIKANSDYAKGIGEAQQLRDYVNAARSGNQAAAANVPIEALRAIVNRVNRQELERQGGQSWARRIDDYATKGVEGHPSPQTLSDFDQLASIGANKALGVYGNTIDELNAQGAKYPRMPAATQGLSPTAAAPKAVASRADFDALPSGATYINSRDGKLYRKP